MPQYVLIGVVIGSVVGFIAFIYLALQVVAYVKKYRLKLLRDSWSQYYAPSVRGNFVRLYKTPIEKDYTLDLEHVRLLSGVSNKEKEKHLIDH
jgi:hypothetical protein